MKLIPFDSFFCPACRSFDQPAIARRRSVFFLVILMLVSAKALGVLGNAAELYWDQNGATLGTGGTGTWTTANLWRLGSTSGTLQTWADGNNAHLEGTPGIVTISGGTTVTPLTSFFEVTGYTLRSTNTSLTTLAGSISLSASVNLNYLSSADTTDRQLAIGSVTGGAGSGLTFSGGQTAAGSNARFFLSQVNSSVDVPVTISGAGNAFAGFVASATGTGITGTINNNSNFTTLLGATSGNDLTLSSTAVISGSAAVSISVTNSGVNVGSVTLNAVNTYLGGTTLNGGTLVLGNNSALSSGTLTLSNSSTSVLQAGGGSRTLANNIVWGGNGTISGINAFTLNGSFTSSGSNSRTLTVNNTGGVTIAGSVYLSESDSSARTLTINGSNAVTINGVITNNNAGNTLASSLTYTGTSTLILSNANTYKGATTVTNGKLLVSGSISGSTVAVSPGAGATAILASSISGSSIAPTAASGTAVTIGSSTAGSNSRFAPGDVGTIGTANFTLQGTAQMAFAANSELNFDISTGTADKVAFAAAPTTGEWLTNSAGSATLQLNGGINYGQTYTVFENAIATSITGTFAFNNIVGYDTVNWAADFHQTGNNYVLSFNPVPEPSTVLSLVFGTSVILGARRFRRLA